MDNIINITVRNRIAFADPGQCIICGNEDYTAVFDFDDEWNGIETKTARFYRRGIFTDVIFTGNEVKIPEMVNVFNVEIGVFAEDITTTPATVRCYKSILCNGGNVADPEPSVYAQIIMMLKNIGAGGGGAGQPGVGIASIEHTLVGNDVHEIKITRTDGQVTAFTVRDGAQGANGVGIHEIGESPLNRIGENGLEEYGKQITVVMTDGERYTFDMLHGEKGEKGEPGFSPTVTVTRKGSLVEIEATNANGQVSAASVSDGLNGSAGADGIGIRSVEQTTTSTADGGANVITVTKTNGETSTFTVKNGSKGSTGATGPAGADGMSVTVKSVSESTADGGSNVVTFSDGKTLTVKNGGKGSTGAAGKDGSDASVTAANIASALGYTPAKQTDVNNLSEQKANKQGLSLGVGADGLIYLFVDGSAQGNGLDINADVVASDVVGYVDSNNTIILTGALANGAYTLKYEYDDGRVVEIGTLNHTSDIGPTYTNIMEQYTINLNKRWSASSKAHSACNGMIEFKLPWSLIKGKTVRFKGFPGNITASNNLSQTVWVNSSDTRIDSVKYTADGSNNIWTAGGTYESDDVYAFAFNSATITDFANSNIDGVRLSLPVKASAITQNDLANLIITVDEPIV